MGELHHLQMSPRKYFTKRGLQKRRIVLQRSRVLQQDMAGLTQLSAAMERSQSFQVDTQMLLGPERLLGAEGSEDGRVCDAG